MQHCFSNVNSIHMIESSLWRALLQKKGSTSTIHIYIHKHKQAHRYTQVSIPATQRYTIISTFYFLIQTWIKILFSKIFFSISISLFLSLSLSFSLSSLSPSFSLHLAHTHLHVSTCDNSPGSLGNHAALPWYTRQRKKKRKDEGVCVGGSILQACVHYGGGAGYGRD